MDVVAGVGYVGRRLLSSRPARTRRGLSRSVGGDDIIQLNLDNRDIALVDVPEVYTVTYTVPPARDELDDHRLRRFLDALPTPPRRFVYLSTTGVYGNRDGDRVDETSLVRPASERAQRRVDAERRLVTFCNQHARPLVVLRVPGIYGPGRLGIDRIKDGKPMLQETDANPGNRIHVDDLVSCCNAALDDAVPAGIYNVGDGDERSSTWFANEVARQMGLPSPPTVSRKQAEKTFSARRLSYLGESRRLDLTKMKTILGVEPKYGDAAEGIAASLEDESE